MSVNDGLWTPEYILEPTMAMFGVNEFGLDPCWNPQSKVKARVKVTAQEDSLRPGFAWHDKGEVWLNPPYSDPYPFLRRMAEAVVRGALGAALLRHDHTTKWWEDWCYRRPIALLSARPKFGGSKNGGKFSSTLVLFAPPSALGALKEPFHKHFASLGEVRW